ncbi:glycerophosphocholine cholinephosphodiesterase ENPP6-like isoform X1 [Tubulanus polymorphus]|uniref:glycerophosphocholine cholinephosphodiesterase ENPP6-like isoform X1 n=1 Tax=Tubulanus polymorphus TaxID=672921 RepID=UPI003DA37228
MRSMFVSTALILQLIVLTIELVTGHNKLMIILLDGFRSDYADTIGNLKGFDALKRRGVQARYMNPTFPSMSYPNYYSIMTGLYSESHGMVGNTMYDHVYGTKFDGEALEPYWWNGGDPVWITATRQGRRCAMFYWCGCEVEIRNLRPAYCRRYTKLTASEDFRWSIDKAIQTMTGKNAADFTAIYVEMTDNVGHQFGPFSKQLNDTVRVIDEHIQYLLSRLDTTGLSKTTNVIFVSDHGMADIRDQTKYIRMTDFVPNIEDLIQYRINPNSHVLIMPKPGATEKIYNGFKGRSPHFDIYRKPEIPERWHFKNNDRIPELVILAKTGYSVVDGYGRSPGMWGYKDTGPARGNHGFDPAIKSMKSIFMATGPDFVKGKLVETIDSIDVYNLMCHLLDIVPSPNNGSWSPINQSLLDIVANKPRESIPRKDTVKPFYDWVVEPPLKQRSQTMGAAVLLTPTIFRIFSYEFMAYICVIIFLI